jgi:hypothetical protein
MIPIPAFNILALGLKLITHRLIPGLWDPLFKTLYTASMSLQAFLLFSAVCSVCFFNLLSSAPTSIVVSRIGSRCLRDSSKFFCNKCFSDPRSTLGVFYRQYRYHLVSPANGWYSKQLGPLWRWPAPGDPVSRRTPFAHRHGEYKRFESANVLVRSDSVCSISQCFTKPINYAHRFKRLSNRV